MPRAVVVFLAALAVAGSAATPASCAEPDFVGVLALALEDDVAKQLDLTADQKEKLLEVVDARESEAVELALQLKNLAPAERAEKLAPFRRESEAKGLALLGAAQRAKLEQIRIRRLGVAALAEAEIAQRLKLTPEQQAQVSGLLKKQQEGRGPAGRAGMFAADPEAERQVAGLLSAEQRTAWTALTSAPVAESPAPSQPAASESAKPAAAAATAAPLESKAPPAKSPEEEKRPKRDGDTGKETTSEAAKPAEAAPAKPGKLIFSFRYVQWKEVLDWLAQQGGYSLEYDSLPQGTFNYTDPREYTPLEAINVINGILLTKGFSLAVHDRTLRLINLKDPVPPLLIPDVKREDLDKRGEFELVRVSFELKNLSPEDVQQEIQGLVGPQGSVLLLPRSRQIRVTETAGVLRVIRDAIDAIEAPGGRAFGQLKIFPLKCVTCEEALSVLRQLLDLSADKNAAPDGSIRVMADSSGRRILAMGKPDKMARVNEIIEALDLADSKESGDGANALRLEVYNVVGASPESVLQVLQTLMSGSAEVRLAIDTKTGNLVAMARPAQHAIIKSTLEQLQRDARRVEVMRLRIVDPQVAVSAINKLFGGAAAGAMAPTVEANVASRQLLIRGSEEQIKLIQTLLEQMGEAIAAGDEDSMSRHVRVVPLTGRAAREVMSRIGEVWPTVRRNPIREVRPSSPIPTIRISESTETGAEPAGAAASPYQGESYWEQMLAPAPAAAARKAEAPAQRNAAEQQPNAPPKPAAEQPSLEKPQTEKPQPEQKSAGPALLPHGRPLIHFVAETKEQAPPPVDSAPAPIIVAPGPGGLMIASQDAEALNAFEQLLTTLSAGSSTGGSDMAIFYLKHAKAVAVAETLDQIFGGGTTTGGGPGGGSGGLMGDLAQVALGPMGGVVGSLLGGGGSITPSGPVQITPDARLNALIVKAAPADLDTIEELLKILDQKHSGEDNLAEPKPRLIPVFNTQADEVAQVVRQVYQDRMVTGAGGGGGQQPSPQQFIEMLSRARGGRGGARRTEDVQKMSIGVDARTNSLVVCAPDALFQEVRDLVEQLDMGAIDSHQVMRVLPLEKASPAVVQRALTAIMGQGVQMGRPSTPGTTPGAPPGAFPTPMPGQSPFGFWRGGPMMPGADGTSPTPFTPQSPFGSFRSSRGMRSGFSPFGGGQPGSFQPGSSSGGRRSFRSSGR